MVLELFQVQASPGNEVASTMRFPANKGMDRLPENVAFTDWGGPLVERKSEVRKIAMKIVDRARAISEKLEIGQGATDQSDFTWGAGVSMLKELFGTQSMTLILEDFTKVRSPPFPASLPALPGGKE